MKRKKKQPTHARCGRRSTATPRQTYAWAHSLLRYTRLDRNGDYGPWLYEERSITDEVALLPNWALGAVFKWDYAAEDPMRGDRINRILDKQKYRSYTIHYVVKSQTRKEYAPIPELEALRARKAARGV